MNKDKAVIEKKLAELFLKPLVFEEPDSSAALKTAQFSGLDKAVPVNRLSEASGMSHFNRRVARSSETSHSLGA